MAIANGKKVTVEYTGTLDDGTLFDSSEKHQRPLIYQAGAGEILPGVEEAVAQMKIGEEKDVSLEPARAYGERQEQLVKTIPLSQLPAGVQAGSIMLLKLPNGVQMPVKVLKIEGENAKVDLNHPLAGERLHFKLRLVKVE